MPSCVLIRLANDTLWMVRAEGIAWTKRRITRLSEILHERGLSNRSGGVGRTLSGALGIPGAELVTPRLEPVDPEQWQIDRIACALVQREHGRGARGATARTHAVRAVADALLAQLSGAVDKVLAQLEPWSVDAARVAGSLDIRLYNFFAAGPVPKYRLQFAKTFPLLIKITVTDGAHEDGAAIRALVDGGTSMIDGLHRFWGVRPVVIRAMVGLTPELAGRDWESQPRTLALALDQLDRQHWPKPNSAEWSGFNRAQYLFAQSLRAVPGLRSLALEWVRRTGATHWSEAGVAALERTLSQMPWGRVGILKKALLSVGLGVPMEDVGQLQDTSLAKALDDYLGSLSAERLVDVAQRFDENLTRITADSSSYLAMLRASTYLPLFPGEFTSSDRSRRLTPMCSKEALIRVGDALQVCLAGRPGVTYQRRCAGGKSFLVEIADAQSDAPLSAAEIRLWPGERDGEFVPVVAEHRAFLDRKASAGCCRAVEELLEHCRSDAIQQHLRRGLANLAAIAEQSRAAALRAAHQRILERALRITLGDRTYELLAIPRGAGKVSGRSASATERGATSRCSS